MQVVLTALPRACQSSILSFKHNTCEKFKTLPAPGSLFGFGSRKSSFNILAFLGLLSFIAASAPAHAAAPKTQVAPARHMASQQGSADPLEQIVPLESAGPLPYEQLVEMFVTSAPPTNPPVTAGDTDEIDVTPVEYMVFEEMRVPVWIVDTIMRASEMTGADPVYMMALADKESSFLPGNKASTSSAVGLFQFITSTWLEAVRSFGPKHGLIMEASAIEKQGIKLSVSDEAKREHILGLRRNPFISALMAAEMMQRDKAKIEARLGRKLSRSEFYLSHFFGVDSASRFIALVDDKPKKSAKSAFPRAAKSNKSLFFAQSGKKTRQLSVSEVYDKIDSMIDKRLDRYEDVSARVTADAGL